MNGVGTLSRANNTARPLLIAGRGALNVWS